MLKEKATGNTGAASCIGDELAQWALKQLGGADVVINHAGLGLTAHVKKLQTPNARWLQRPGAWLFPIFSCSQKPEPCPPGP